MRKAVLPAVLLLFVGGCDRKPPESRTCPSKFHEKPRTSAPTKAQLRQERAKLETMLRSPCSPACCEAYIEQVVNNGSDVLHLPSGPMAGGFASPEDAQKIAAYVVTLAGKPSPHPQWVQEGSLLYAGNCAGCHGGDAKGQGGAFPDLTLPELRGMALRRRAMQRRLETLVKLLGD